MKTVLKALAALAGLTILALGIWLLRQPCTADTKRATIADVIVLAGCK